MTSHEKLMYGLEIAAGAAFITTLVLGVLFNLHQFVRFNLYVFVIAAASQLITDIYLFTVEATTYQVLRALFFFVMAVVYLRRYLYPRPGLRVQQRHTKKETING